MIPVATTARPVAPPRTSATRGGSPGHRGGPPRRRTGRAAAAVALAASVMVAACSSGTTPAPASAGASGGGSSSGTLTPLKIGLGYIPSVQFAQFYYAEQAGYYRAAGLQVSFENKIDPDLVVLVGQGALDLGIADGTSVIPAVSQDIPIRYLATIYATFPNIVFAKKSSGIATAADLKGRKIGTPGKYGSGWIQLQALLASAKLTTSDVQVVPFPDFGQSAAVASGTVDAATGYSNNEPIQLQQQGVETNVVTGLAVTPLPGPGLIASNATLAAKRAAIKGFVDATLHAMRDIVADPAKGLDATLSRVPDLAKSRDVQLKVLEATIAAWQSDYTKAHGLGAVDPQTWTDSITFMQGLPDKLVKKPVTVDQLIATDLVGG